MKMFYNVNRPSMLLDEHSSVHLITAGAERLATRQGSTHCLIGNDMAGSPVLISGPQGTKAPVFSAYGTPLDRGEVLGFKGELYDPSTGYYLLGNGYRAYTPALMRFNRSDHDSPFARGGLNAYVFVLGDPVNRSDPTGHFFEFIISRLSKLFTSKIYRGKIVAEFDGIVAFNGPTRADGSSTLYISAHGAPGYISGDKRILYDGLRLHKTLTAHGVPMRGRQTHLLACDSAAPNPRTGRSVATDLASMTEAQSSGYSETLSIDTSRQGSEFVVRKYMVVPMHGMTSKKTRAGYIRNPHKLGNDDHGKHAHRITIV